MSTPAIDFDGICVAFAARFLDAAMGHPTNETAIRQSYAESPKNTPSTPAHLLEVQDGSVIINNGQWQHTFNVDGLLILSKRPGDTARVEKTRKKWLPFLLHATEDQMKLGLGGASGYTVNKAYPTGWEWTEYEVAGSEYDAIRVHWAIDVFENVSLIP